MPGKLIFCVLSLLIAYLIPRMALAEDNGATARGIFSRLPPSIFENTPEGLTEGAKQELLTTGRSEFWEIARETPDMLVFAELPFRDRSVALRLFRNRKDGSTEIALGTLGEEICTMELWRLDVNGRLVPVDGPEEPKFREFYAKKISHKSGQTVLICLGDKGLQAYPILWNDHGFSRARTDYGIRFIWDGSGFRKVIYPLEKTSQTPHPGTSSAQNRQ